MPSRSRFAHPPTEDAELTRGEGMVVQMARQAFGQVIETYSPDGSDKLALGCVAIAGLFADTVCKMSNAADICTVVNHQLAASGFELVKKRRH
jgi:hypothetical protein